LNPARWEEMTVEAERLGFNSVWMAEHLVMPMPAGQPTRRFRSAPDPAGSGGTPQRFFGFGPVAFEPKPVQQPGVALHMGATAGGHPAGRPGRQQGGCR
jgi:hypothetical protein